MADVAITLISDPDLEMDSGLWEIRSFCSIGARNIGYSRVPPSLTAQTPAPSATGVLGTSTIAFTVTDELEGVWLPSVQVSINLGAGFVTAYSTSAFQNSWAGTVTPSGLGFVFVLEPPTLLPGGQTIQVRVIALDDAPIRNELDTTYSFATAPIGIAQSITATNEGYGPVDLTGSIPVGIYRAYVGSNGDNTDPQVYNGIPGSGGFLIEFVAVSPGVTKPRRPVYFPPLPLGGPYDITLVGDSTFVVEDEVTVVPSGFGSKTSNLRRILPPSYKAGPRTLSTKKFPQE